jgi:hypothetical protein
MHVYLRFACNRAGTHAVLAYMGRGGRPICVRPVVGMPVNHVHHGPDHRVPRDHQTIAEHYVLLPADPRAAQGSCLFNVITTYHKCIVISALSYNQGCYSVKQTCILVKDSHACTVRCVPLLVWHQWPHIRT